MQNRRMPHRYVVPNQCGMGLALHMDDGAVLNIGASPHADPIDVAADDDVHPDTTVLADLNVADDLCAVVYERRGGYSRGARAVGPKHLW